jgi:hypothetical protein
VGHLHHQLRRAFDVVVVTDSRLAPGVLVDAEEAVGLRLVVEVEADGRIVTDRYFRRGGGVREEPSDDGTAGLAVIGEADGRGHVDGALDELGLLDVRHCLVAPSELVARETVAVLERRDWGGSGGHGTGDSSHERAVKTIRCRFGRSRLFVLREAECFVRLAKTAPP